MKPYHERKKALCQGLPLALLPALLIFPAFALLTICPPRFGPIVMYLLLVVFLVSEILAIGVLTRALERTIDWITLGSLLGTIVALAVLALCVYSLG
jgi:hypothetical protein